MTPHEVETRNRPVASSVSTIPCETCGSLPVGEYPTGRTIDDRRRYGCGPHRPFKVSLDGTRVYLDETKP